MLLNVITVVAWIWLALSVVIAIFVCRLFGLLGHHDRKMRSP